VEVAEKLDAVRKFRRDHPLGVEQKARVRAWVVALEEEGLKPQRGRLGDAGNGFCCLGVACLVADRTASIGECRSTDSHLPIVYA